MEWRDEARIRAAIRSGRAEELDLAVRRMYPEDRNLDELQQLVRDAGGGGAVRGWSIDFDGEDGETTVTERGGMVQSRYTPRRYAGNEDYWNDLDMRVPLW